ncbi:putative bifunctional diguanylate cyclase/phosphodiesterase [Euzebya rosea]|uniref:putative bifunctional diguanylate cyclase/phosphodiesterase n=1 Tax=Euzebya rosea TaxID=2052804 RepID=UPI000D3E7011|nr:EAL domain-containing protein [Euzebya rosea]
MRSRSPAMARRPARSSLARTWDRWRLTPVWTACFATVVAVALRGGLAPPAAASLVLAVGLLTWRAARVTHEHRTLVDAVDSDRRRLQTLLGDVADQVVICNDHGLVTEVVGAVAGMPVGTSEMAGTRLLDLVHESDRASALAAMEGALAHPGSSTPWEGRVRLPDGRTAWINAAVVDRRGDPDVHGMVVTFRDVTDRRKAEQELERLALFDPLTGLPSRATLVTDLRTALRHASPTHPISVLYCDLDRLKVVNDSLGHHTGDLLIAAVAKRWVDALPSHTTLSRFGGDEFVVLAPYVEEGPGPAVVADAMVAALNQSIVVAGYELTVTASIGIATVVDSGKAAEDVLRDADAALYEAKTGGRNRVVLFDDEMGDAAVERLLLESDLRSALRSGLIEVHLQPIMDLATNRPSSFEALLRWEHPVRGWVRPDRIVHVAEETGLIVELGNVVLELSCQAIAWMRDLLGTPVKVAVNTSPLQLARAEFMSTVDQVLRRYDLPASALVIEVTEGILLDPAGQGRATLQALHHRGIGISLDDFGTGYSSLSYLGTFPLDQLKLDRTITTGATETPTGLAVLRGVLHMTEQLGLPVVAEGLETDEQIAQLTELGATHGQGWGFAPAMPVAEAIKWARGWVTERAQEPDEGGAASSSPPGLSDDRP